MSKFNQLRIEELLDKDKSMTTHKNNLQMLMVEI